MTFVFKTGVAHQSLPLHGTHTVFVSSGTDNERYKHC